MTASEIAELQLLDEDYSYHSGGSECDEPRAFVRNLDETRRCVVAKLSHGITSDPWQFVAGDESSAAVKHSCATVREWIDELPMPNQSSSARKCPMCIQRRGRSSATSDVVDDAPSDLAIDVRDAAEEETASALYLSGHRATSASGCLSCSCLSMHLPQTPLHQPPHDPPPGWASGPDGPRYGESPQAVPLRRHNISEDILARHLAMLRKATAA
jgi:hypothetical protein